MTARANQVNRYVAPIGRLLRRGVLTAVVGLGGAAIGHAQPPGVAGDAPGAPPVPPGAVRVVAFTWHERRVAICAEEPGPPITHGTEVVPRTRVWVRDGTKTYRIVVGAGSCDPAWSPDGGRLAVVAPDGLWVLSADLRQTTHLVDTRQGDAPANERNRRRLKRPTWAPDGSALAMLATNGSTTWVEVVDARSGVRLWASDAETYEFVWGDDARSLQVGSRVVRFPRD